MFAGHVGAALAIGRADPQVNVGVFVTAAFLLDLLLWLLVLLGWESVSIPADFASTRQPAFDFPYSHGLAGSVLWSTCAGAVAFIVAPRGTRLSRWRLALLVAGAVFSHWLLDALVHRPELPVGGADSVKVGLALWDHMPAALAIEAGIVVVGLWIFTIGSRLSRRRSIGLVVLALVIVVFTMLGVTIAPPPPSALAMAASSLVTVTAVCAVAWWLGRPGDVRRSGGA
jgi:hypothetical protein